MDLYRDRKVTIRLTASEYQQIQSSFTALGYFGNRTVSNWIRRAIGDKLKQLRDSQGAGAAMSDKTPAGCRTKGRRPKAAAASK